MRATVMLIVLFFFCGISYGQKEKEESIISLFQLAIKSNPTQFVYDYKKEFSNLDSNLQIKVLDYLYTYNTDSILYMNINNLHQVLEIYYMSNYTQIRQRATNLLLETYRLTHGSTSLGWVWYKNARQSDFNDEAKKSIMRIIKCEPFSNMELDLLYKYELRLIKNSYSKDTLRIRKYRKKSSLSLNNLRDSVATVVAESNITNVKPSKYLDELGVFYLASWLYMDEVIPYIEKAMADDHPESKKYYKLPLARLGNKVYEIEFLDSMYKTNNFDYHIIGFLRNSNSLNAIIGSLKLIGKPKGKISAKNREGKWVEVEIEGDPYNCNYLRQLIYQNLIPDLPFNFDGLSLAMCEIPEEDIKNVINWLENNRSSIVLSLDYH